jgi:hypothetical protein
MTTFDTATFESSKFDSATFYPRFAVAPGAGAGDPTRSNSAPATADPEGGVDIGHAGLLALVSAFLVFTVWGTDSAGTLAAFVFFVAVSAWSALQLDRASDDGELTLAASNDASSFTSEDHNVEHDVA